MGRMLAAAAAAAADGRKGGEVGEVRPPAGCCRPGPSALGGGPAAAKRFQSLPPLSISVFSYPLPPSPAFARIWARARPSARRPPLVARLRRWRRPHTATTAHVRCCREGVAAGQRTSLLKTPQAAHGAQAGNSSWLEPPVTWRPRPPDQEYRADKEQQQRRDAPHLQSQRGRAYRYALLYSPICCAQARPQPNNSSQKGRKEALHDGQEYSAGREKKECTRQVQNWSGGGRHARSTPAAAPSPNPLPVTSRPKPPITRTKPPATRRRRYGDCVSPLAASTAAIQRLAAALASKRRVPPKSAVSDSRGMWSYSTE